MKKAIGSIIFAVLAVLTINTMAVGASTPQTPQQQIKILLSDAKAVQAHVNENTCKKLEKASHDYRNIDTTNGMIKTEWIEMAISLNLAGGPICDPGMKTMIDKQVKRAQYRANEILIQIKN